MTTSGDLSARWSTALAQPGIRADLSAARDAIDAVRRLYRRPTAADTARSLLTGAEASARIDGGNGDPDEPDAPTAAAARINAELPDLAATVERAPLQAFARMHVLATDDAIPDNERGRPRLDADTARLAALGRELTARTDRPALATALLAHAELASIAPFPSANAVVARAIERLLLISKGVDPQALVAVEVGHEEGGPRYANARAAYGDGGPTGGVLWLQYGCQAVTVACELAARQLRDRG